MVLLQAIQPFGLAPSCEKARLGLFGEHQIVLAVGPLESIDFPGGDQAFQRMLANCLKHPEAQVAGRLFLAQEVLVDQGRHAVDHVEVQIRPASCDHRFGRGQRAAADEHREATIQHLLVRSEQVVAPGDRLAQGLLANGQIAGPACQRSQPVLQPREQRLRRENVDTRGGELDGQGQAIEAVADLDDRVYVPIGDGELRLGRLCSLEEEPDRLVARQLIDGFPA